MKIQDGCDYCGGRLRRKTVTLDMRRQGRWMVFENLPASVCQECGERYYDAKVLKRVEAIFVAGKVNGRAIRSKVIAPRVDWTKIPG